MNTRLHLVACIGLAAVAGSHVRAQSMDRLWRNNCINCHGQNGQGGGAGTRSLLLDDLLDQKHDRPFFESIKHGVPDKGMAAFGETMSDEEIWGLVNYIRELQARARRERVGSISKKLDSQGVCHTQRADFTIETVATTGLQVPWSVEFLPIKGAEGGAPGRVMIVTNRPGPLMVFDLSGKALGVIEGTPRVRDQGQGGMMDITLHPDYSSGQDWVYLAYADPLEGNASRGFTRIVRGKIKQAGDAWRWTDEQTIFKARPEHYLNGDIHFGCKIVFDHKDHNILFFGIGERGRGELAQDLTRPNGKIYRVHADGSIPSDNPFITTKDAYTAIWSYGHRNPQGLAFDSLGNLWDTEHGPRGGDELNLIQPGRNYGWPLVSFGINYSGAAYKAPWPDLYGKELTDLNIVMPTDRWLPSIGACGLECVRSDLFPNWKGDLLAGGLSGANVDRIRLTPPPAATTDAPSAPSVLEREEVVHGLGRVRDIVSAPDGLIYIVLNDPDKVIRLVPTKR
ncbi:MAG: PQQ-dependent sugar dehydrogenase [Phycisphaerales bacterium]